MSNLLSLSRWLIAMLLFSHGVANAAPMGFKDATMWMLDLNPDWRELSVNYAITPRDAFGLSVIDMRTEDNSKKRTLEEATYTRLLNRWNLPNAQANLWLFAGVGALQGTDKHDAQRHRFDEVMLTPGIQFDYETTRVYVAATHRLYRAPQINHDFGSVRAGFSFYETDYEQTQPWLILEARHMNGLSDGVEITPMLRFINRRFFVEFGINNASQPRFNMMYAF